MTDLGQLLLELIDLEVVLEMSSCILGFANRFLSFVLCFALSHGGLEFLLSGAFPVFLFTELIIPLEHFEGLFGVVPVEGACGVEVAGGFLHAPFILLPRRLFLRLPALKTIGNINFTSVLLGLDHTRPELQLDTVRHCLAVGRTQSELAKSLGFGNKLSNGYLGADP